MKKLLFVSDGLWTPSGFGCVMQNLIKRLKDKYEVALLSWQYVGNKQIVEGGEFEGVQIYPINKHQFGKDVLYYVIEDFNPDILITLGDYWMLNYLANKDYQDLLKEKDIKWVWYLPVDSEVIPIQFRDLIRGPDKLIAMSQFAHELLDKRNIPNTYKEELKEKEGYGGKFVIGIVNRNQNRKQLPRAVEAFAKFAKDKDDVVLHLHCDPFDPGNLVADYNGGAHPLLMNAITHFGVNDRVHFSKEVKSYINGVNVKGMKDVYNMFDVTVNSGSGEGFGLTIVESMACGVPVIMTNTTTAKELIEGHGLLVKPAIHMWGGYGTMRAIVDVDDLAAKMQYYYDNRDKLKEDSIKSLEFVKGYDWNKTVPKWIELFEQL